MADPSRNFGKYEILEPIGRGGFATVYRARDTVLDRAVALKVLAPHLIWDPDFVARFKQEARVAAHLRHPSIVAIYEIDEVEGQLFIAMELVTAGSLRDYMQAQGPLSVAATVELLAPIADALDEAHSQGLVHRDIKPANILLEKTRTGKLRPLLTDFGLVKALSQHSELTRTGAILGTAEYMAPEQIDIDRVAEVGPATDIYALGIVVYHMLTGQVPFSGSSAQVMYAHMNKTPPAPSAIRADLPAAVSGSVLRALAKGPGDRFPDATDFIESLAAASQPAPIAPPATAVVVPPAPIPQPAPAATPSRPSATTSRPEEARPTAAEPPVLAQAVAAAPSAVPAAPVSQTDAPAAAEDTPTAAGAPAVASQLSALFRSPSKPLFAASERPRFIVSLLIFTVIGSALGWPLAIWIGGPLTDWTWEVPLTGLVFGAIVAAFQASKLSGLLPGRIVWVLATGAGAMLASMLVRNIDLDQTAKYFLAALLTLGLLQALALWRGLHPIWAVAWAPVLAAAWVIGLKLAWSQVSATDGGEIKYIFGAASAATFDAVSNLFSWDRAVTTFGYLGWLIRGAIFGAVIGAAQSIYLALARGRQPEREPTLTE